jgi:hypothetical protein
MKHLRYLQYVLVHKWYVWKCGLRLGVPLWRLLVHDWSKFSWTEWTAYANYFYGDFPEHDPNDPNKWTRRGYYGPTSIDIEEKFQRAWLHHIHLNDHHPQHWVLLNDDSTITTLNMPFVAVLEMLAYCHRHLLPFLLVLS